MDPLDPHGNAGSTRKARWSSSDKQNGSILVQCLESKFEVPCEGVSREFWSDIQGEYFALYRIIVYETPRDLCNEL